MQEISVFSMNDGGTLTDLKVFSTFDELERYGVNKLAPIAKSRLGHDSDDFGELEQLCNDITYSYCFHVPDGVTLLFITTLIVNGDIKSHHGCQTIEEAKVYLIENLAHKVGLVPSRDLDHDIAKIKDLLAVYSPTSSFSVMGFKLVGNRWR